MRDRVVVRVPATTSNLGPGFDALGLALGVYNTVVATPAPSLSIEIAGEGAGTLPRDASNVLVASLARGLREAGSGAPREVPPLRLACDHAIPPARGLGSSAAAVVAGLLLADALTDGALGREGVLALATSIEGHPDNAAPAVYGGLQAAAVTPDGRVHRVTSPVAAPVRVALFVPEFPMPTREARAVLPATLSRADAVFNISRTALLVAALAAGELSALSVATEDALHQRPREAIFREMPALFRAAREAGACGAWLSGAGSTVAAFATRGRADAVAAAMADEARRLGVAGRALVTDVDPVGATVARG